MSGGAPTNSELETRVSLLEQSIHEIRDNTTAMAGSLQSLTRLEERHVEMARGIERAFQTIEKSRNDQQATNDDVERRLKALENEAPLMRIARNMVFSFMGGCTILVLLYIARLAGLWAGGSLPHP